MKEVKKIFPNAKEEDVINSLPKDNWTWYWGEVSTKNYPELDHKTIRKINKMALTIATILTIIIFFMV